MISHFLITKLCFLKEFFPHTHVVNRSDAMVCVKNELTNLFVCPRKSTDLKKTVDKFSHCESYDHAVCDYASLPGPLRS